MAQPVTPCYTVDLYIHRFWLACRYYFHCWEATVNGTALLSDDNDNGAATDNNDEVSDPSSSGGLKHICGRPGGFGDTGDTWVHADQAFPDFASHQQQLSSKQAAEVVCRARLSRQRKPELPTNNDVPHFIAPTDLSLTDVTADMSGVVHRSWSAGLLGVECEREVRNLISKRYTSGRRWFYSTSRLSLIHI